MTTPNRRSRLGGAVMAWTAFTTAFLWTATTRGLFRPDISTWSVMGTQGTGNGGSFWLFPTLAAVALLTFYLYGRDRLRPLYHALLLIWHGLLTFIGVAGVMQEGGAGDFEGAIWGVRIPLGALVVPLAGFLALTIVWSAGVWRARHRPAGGTWTAVDRRALALALLLLPVAFALFRIGDGIDGPTRFATAATILQWILLTQAVSDAEPASARASRRLRSVRTFGDAAKADENTQVST